MSALRERLAALAEKMEHAVSDGAVRRGGLAAQVVDRWVREARALLAETAPLQSVDLTSKASVPCGIAPTKDKATGCDEDGPRCVALDDYPRCTQPPIAGTNLCWAHGGDLVAARSPGEAAPPPSSSEPRPAAPGDDPFCVCGHPRSWHTSAGCPASLCPCMSSPDKVHRAAALTPTEAPALPRGDAHGAPLGPVPHPWKHGTATWVCRCGEQFPTMDAYIQHLVAASAWDALSATDCTPLPRGNGCVHHCRHWKHLAQPCCRCGDSHPPALSATTPPRAPGRYADCGCTVGTPLDEKRRCTGCGKPFAGAALSATTPEAPATVCVGPCECCECCAEGQCPRHAADHMTCGEAGPHCDDDSHFASLCDCKDHRLAPNQTFIGCNRGEHHSRGSCRPARPPETKEPT